MSQRFSETNVFFLKVFYSCQKVLQFSESQTQLFYYINPRNIWELGEFSKVQKLQSPARILTIHLSVNSDGFSCTMPSD